MTKSFFKVFFSKSKEQDWLNELGKDGYLLKKISDSKYYFDISDSDKYTYSIEYLDCSPKSEMADEYYKSREEKNIVPIITSGNWVYFCGTNSIIEDCSEIYNKNSSFYFWRCFYLLFFSVFGAVLSGYQAFAAKFIPAVGHTGNGRFGLLELEENAADFVAFLNVLKKWWNGILELLNNTYLKLLTNIFGENDTVFVQAIVIPLVIVLSILFALNFEQYILYRKKAKNSKSRDKKEILSTLVFDEADIDQNNASEDSVNG